MPPGADGGGAPELPPDDAFAVLGNETRMQILQTLGEADEPMSFTDLRERLGIRQGGQFNYHLEKVVGHFVAKTDEGYLLRQPGRRVVQAVKSGAITDDREREYTELDEACWICGGPIGISYRQERMDLYCTECSGTYGEPSNRWPAAVPAHDPDHPPEVDFLGTFFLPAGGLVDRDAGAAYRAGFTWEMLENLAISNDVCPRCAGPVEKAVEVCEDHQSAGELCDDCGNLYAVNHVTSCRHCPYQSQGTFVHVLYGKRELKSFLTTNGSSPLSVDEEVHPFRVVTGYDEEVHSTEPFRATFTFTVDEESLALTVDETFSVTQATRS